MWLITPLGFFSVVQKSEDARRGTLTVRSRVRGDLVALKQYCLPGLGPIRESHDADYRFRAVAPREQVSAAMAGLIDGLRYSNFKSEVAKKQGHKRANLYHQVWDVLHQLQTAPAFVETEPVVDSYGGVVISGGGKVLLREPANRHGGNAWTFAKTAVQPGESPRDAAVRAVRDKTGYAAEIRISVPGTFKGSTSSACYYVMDATHPPGKPNWQTAGIRWVDLEEARELIRQSSNAEGRDRDLAILDAAQKVAGAIAYNEHPNVQPEDWQELKAMPAQQTVLRPAVRFTPDEMMKIRRGFYPTVMEQKWFLYFTRNWLRMHRSWTGILIYDVGFEVDPDGGGQVTEVVVNRDSREYSSNDDGEDLRLLEDIIRSHLLQPLEEPAVDGFVKTMSLAMQPQYLGSPEVVSGLIKNVVDVFILMVNGEADEDELTHAVGEVIFAFTEDAARYTRMPGWHNVEQMGAYVEKYLIEKEQGASLADILGHGMTALRAKLQEIVDGSLKVAASNWEVDALAQINALHQFVVTVLLGTNRLHYGEKTLAEFRWRPVDEIPEEKLAIVELGAEGGSVTLYGRESPAGWSYRVESRFVDLLDEEQGAAVVLAARPWAETWRAALKQLDAYPWTRLVPLGVHPDFRTRVIRALQARQKKGAPVAWSSWSEVLEIDVDS